MNKRRKGGNGGKGVSKEGGKGEDRNEERGKERRVKGKEKAEGEYEKWRK